MKEITFDKITEQCRTIKDLIELDKSLRKFAVEKKVTDNSVPASYYANNQETEETHL